MSRDRSFQRPGPQGNVRSRRGAFQPSSGARLPVMLVVGGLSFVGCSDPVGPCVTRSYSVELGSRLDLDTRPSCEGALDGASTFAVKPHDSDTLAGQTCTTTSLNFVRLPDGYESAPFGYGQGVPAGYFGAAEAPAIAASVAGCKGGASGVLMVSVKFDDVEQARRSAEPGAVIWGWGFAPTDDGSPECAALLAKWGNYGGCVDLYEAVLTP